MQAAVWVVETDGEDADTSTGAAERRPAEGGEVFAPEEFDLEQVRAVTSPTERGDAFGDNALYLKAARLTPEASCVAVDLGGIPDSSVPSVHGLEEALAVA